ncbi:SDR family oxidoreductase [Rhodocytophaga rosea]|uniref:SDR family oxidoreductase n=1 Tax=Rhodocytophaga rosea TaxID=2704465 RepID=A0A6C0GHH2_9BACT|nr:SDR family oxidoreductase [Rhodocytophaga rosea]QHT67521.1 SDR family oxidoreductase [Rhodocytophaga rosea]
MDLQLAGKVVLVTGGASGIGEAIVRTFAQEGAIPVIIGRDPSKAEKLLQDLQQQGAKTLFVKAELTIEAECKQAIEQTLQTFNRIDCLVNNAGINDGVSLDQLPSEFVKSLQKNLVHYFTMAHYAKPALAASKGCIINIGSKVANTGQGGTSGYAASKGGIQALTREWAVSLLSEGIRVNEVIPAEVWTPLYDSWIKTFPNPQEKLDEITRRIPLGKRFTTSEEIADAVVFLASSRASHITGQHIYVDGGYTHLDRSIGT